MASRFRVRLHVQCATPPTVEQLQALRGGRWNITASRRGGKLLVTLTMDSFDLGGALTRSVNTVLDRVAGEVVYAEVTLLDDEVARRRSRSTERPSRTARGSATPRR